ncbi:ABC transporter ATP-binding protein [Paenibacillus paeoniae]|uniref:ABC transporter ATP-binding protein n=2 Tax=Paenibacillus paeoniae TaxID=2292705 RepID=A0A371PIR2_9BACL|nr:ABC transporter ATP-binding protein [Paenibacillus paeoniae]
MIKVKGLQKSFRHQHGTQLIIDMEEWSAKSGDAIALLGPSGSGKSTFLHLLGGVLPIDEGILEVGGQSVSGMRESERDAYRARLVGYVFQDFYLMPSLTVRQNVELVLPRGLGKAERDGLLESWFERVGLLERMNQLPSKLSRGQQQRVAIIRAMINRPPLILADEPTGSLDWETAADIMGLLLDICAESGSTLVTVTHDRHLAELFKTKLDFASINQCLSVHQTGLTPIDSRISEAGGVRA